MIDLGSTTIEPIESWDHWPLNRLKKGDIVRVCWTYDGVHGPVWSEDIYLLMECTSKKGNENWKVTQLFENRNGMKTETTNFKQSWIHSNEFTNEIPGDWQRISLIARADNGDR